MNFIGHKQTISRIKCVLAKGRLGHAVLFSGPKHIGKFLLAQSIAHALIDGRKSISFGKSNAKGRYHGSLTVCRRMQDEDGKSAKEITVAQVREATKSLSLRQSTGSARTLLIDGAEEMSDAAQNALLKTLEEPPKNVFVFLVTHNKNALRQTIVSRCEEFSLGLVAREDMKNACSDKEKIQLSGGRPGILLKMQENDVFFEEIKNTIKEYDTLPTKSRAERFSLAERLAKDPAETVASLTMWLFSVHMKSQENPAPEHYQLLEKIQKSVALLSQTNANTRLVLENLFLHIEGMSTYAQKHS